MSDVYTSRTMPWPCTLMWWRGGVTGLCTGLPKFGNIAFLWHRCRGKK